MAASNMGIKHAIGHPAGRVCYLRMVAGQLQEQLPAIRIPVLEQPVLAHRENVVRVGNESDLRFRHSTVNNNDSSE